MLCVKFLRLHQCIDEHLQIDWIIMLFRPEPLDEQTNKKRAEAYRLQHIGAQTKGSPQLHLGLLNIAEIKIKTTSMTNVTFIDFQDKVI
jgi:hypothetical protein